MSVLIKGMKMPKNCSECRFCAWKDENDVGCAATGKGADDCPLVELPDHGDLIDKDELKHGFCVECTLYPDNCLKDDCDWDSIYHIEHTPVVIPAERSEE